jgi:cobalamin synthase
MKPQAAVARPDSVVFQFFTLLPVPNQVDETEDSSQECGDSGHPFEGR